MAPELSSSVGRSPADNMPIDVTLVQNFMGAWLSSIRSPMIGIAASWLPMLYDDTLGDVIFFFQKRRGLPKADGRIDREGRTWREMVIVFGKMVEDIPGWPRPPKRDVPPVLDLNVIRIQQRLRNTSPADPSVLSIAPASVMPFLFRPVRKGAMLAPLKVTGAIRQFLFRIEKNGAIFWVGVAVPVGTIDFSRAYIFFHPDTISQTDDAKYPAFTGRWEESVHNYVFYLGVQMAAMKQMVLIVPFMTWASRANSSTTNLFADRGIDTLDDIMIAVHHSLGVNFDRYGGLRQVGVSSYSSGVNHLFRFAEVVGGADNAIIREQIDFDSAYMTNRHKVAPVLPYCVNWNVTQSPPRFKGQLGWLYLPHEAFGKVVNGKQDTHGKIGNMMFHTMMMLSAIQ
ncbi:MAG: hypothetical protein EOP23_05125 [Hyphomicrobiales bacterium]|nr:MAG: hypothetical protein EOP23_05125 [Hyphomicrobiales bacterium]